MHVPTRLSLLLLISALLVSSGWQGQATPAVAAPARPTASAPAADVVYTELAAISESEPNDTLTTTADTANPIGPDDIDPPPPNWSRSISGTIGSEGDVDYFKLEVPPASTVAISLTNLSADFDVTLASGSVDSDASSDGLDNILDTGGSIAAIGGSIAAIGGSIAAIGGSIAAIGGSIAAIGGSIAAISANSGTSDESLETFLWQPGTYYVAITGNGGAASSQPYALVVRLASGSLTMPAPAPDVRVNAPVDLNVQTLFLVNEALMRSRYIGAGADIDNVISYTRRLAADNQGVVIDISKMAQIGGSESLSQIYQGWDNDKANPLAANRVARFVSKLIDAASHQNPSGANPAFSANPLPPAPPINLAQQAMPAQISPVPFPNLRNVVLIGGDDIFPFFRNPDLTSIANESEYASYLRQVDQGGVIDPASALGGALAYKTLLTDNPYGLGRPYRFLGYPLIVPRLAVGRLVETPRDIAEYLRPYTAGALCTPAPCRPTTIDLNNLARTDRAGFVSGYDFLIDSASEISQTLGTFSVPQVRSLINNDWTANDLKAGWFNGNYTEMTDRATYTVAGSYALNSLNAHFDHWRIIPADTAAGYLEATSIYTPQISTGLNRTPYFTSELLYSVGCHSGYNVTASSILASTPNRSVYQADFPQAILKQGGTYVGNTGYGYGSLDSIDYSERLAALFTEELGRDVGSQLAGYQGQPIGRALAIAKMRYLRNATSLSVYDAKALQVMTLYGLPFMRVKVPNPQQPPPEERPDAPALRLVPPVPAGALGSIERILTFTIDLENRAVLRNNVDIGDVPTITAIDVEDSFVPPGSSVSPQARIFRASQIGRPNLPQFAYDITALQAISSTAQLDVRDVTFLGGIYGSEESFNPVISQVVTETNSILSRTTVEPSFTAGAGIWYPDRFYGHSSVGEDADNRDQLVVSAAQFRADSNGSSGIMRPYKQMSFRIRYTDPTASDAQPAIDDQTAPAIESVTLFAGGSQLALQQTSGSTDIVVRVSDGDDETGVGSVEAVYVVNIGGEDTWQHVSFSQDPNVSGALQRWVANVPLDPSQVRVIVTASDKAGNATTYTAKGTFAPPIGRLLYAPMIRR
jgi:hypothetical protein